MLLCPWDRHLMLFPVYNFQKN